MTKVVIINPQLPFNSDIKNDSYIKMGIAYLSSCLKKDGHKVFLVDYRLCKNQIDAIENILINEPDIVCITAFSSEAPEAIKIAKILKNINPKLPLVIGGIHASIRPSDYIEAGCFDYIIRGEGEITVPKIVKNPILSPNPIVIWGETPDLNTLPFPDRKLWSDYDKRILNPPCYVHGSPWVEIISTRGCWANCAFCSAHGEKDHFTREVDGKRKPYIRGRSVSNVIAELIELDDVYHYNGIQFLDDQFIMNPKWGWDFCDAIEETQLTDRHWWIGTRADVLLANKELVLRMKAVGLDIVSVGFESFSDDLLKFWKKGTTVAQNYEAAQFLQKNQINVFSNVIMGAPREDGKWHSEDDIKNIEAIMKIKPSHNSWSIFTAAPGSDLEKWCFEKGISIAHNTGFRNAGESKTKGVNWRQIRIWMNRIDRGRPWYHDAHDYIRMKIEGW